jgi:hypothetical protein
MVDSASLRIRRPGCRRVDLGCRTAALPDGKHLPSKKQTDAAVILQKVPSPRVKMGAGG